MSGSSKILTVSYGTFSCTLEGFDDPFSTMRTIAEYFRDLAADDRYFGAEPPTPDPEMLQNMAEREVEKRVEARLTDGSVALRQLSAPVETRTEPASAPDPASTPASVPAPAAARVGDLTDTPPAFEADEPENAFSDIGAESGTAGSSPESIAEKLKRIRAVVSRSRDAEIGDFPADDGDNAPETPTVPLFGDDDMVEDDAPRAEVPAEAADTMAPSEADLRSAERRETIASLGGAEAEDGDDLDDETTAEEDIGALLDQHFAPVEAATDDAPDEIAPPPTQDDPSAAAVAGDDPSDDVADDMGDEEDDETVLADVAEALRLDDASPDDTASSEDQPAATYDGPEATLTLVSSDAGAPQSDVDSTIAGIMASARDDAVADDGFEDDIVEDETENVSADTGAAPTASGSVAADLSDEDDDRDVSRLMAEADHQFEDNEGQRRRRVISQLRAAVVAAKADSTFQERGTPEAELEDQIAYREDLSRVVSRKVTPVIVPDPVRPTDANAVESGTDGADEKPAIAPLMLGSDQRVDANDAPVEDKTEETVEIHPRRVNLDPDAPSQKDMASFAEFAENMGAKDLLDLLEAAAAYTAFVEGQTSFSRPQIMKRVARIQPEVVLTREAGLRSFGQLLRQGKIQKLHRGEFTISEKTRFNPGHRIAGE